MPSGFIRQQNKIDQMLNALYDINDSSRGNMEVIRKLLLLIHDIASNKTLVLAIREQYKTKPCCTFNQISTLAATIVQTHNDPMLERLHCVLVMDLLHYFAVPLKYAVQLLLGNKIEERKQKVVPIVVGSMKDRLKALHANKTELKKNQPSKPDAKSLVAKIERSRLFHCDEKKVIVLQPQDHMSKSCLSSCFLPCLSSRDVQCYPEINIVNRWDGIGAALLVLVQNPGMPIAQAAPAPAAQVTPAAPAAQVTPAAQIVQVVLVHMDPMEEDLEGLYED